MNRRLILIGIVALSIRLIVLFALGRHLMPEVWEYDTIAQNLLSGNGYTFHHRNTTYHSFGYPLFPLILAASLFLTHHNYLLIYIIQILFSTAIVYLIYYLARKVCSETCAFIAAILTALHPGLIIYATKIHELTFSTFLFLLIFWYMFRFDIKQKIHRLAIGLLVGIGAHLRPETILFVPVFLIYYASQTESIKRSIFLTLQVLLIVILLLIPWTVRNYIVHKRFIFMTTLSAEFFWRGNMSFSSGTSLTKEGKAIVDIAGKEFTEKLYSLDEIAQHDLFIRTAKTYIAKHPGAFLTMFIKKFYYFWWFSPQAGLLYPSFWSSIYKVYYTIILIFAAVGIAVNFKRRHKDIYLLMILTFLFSLLVSLVHSFYYTEIRHRWQIEPFLLLWASYAITTLIRSRSPQARLK